MRIVDNQNTQPAERCICAIHCNLACDPKCPSCHPPAEEVKADPQCDYALVSVKVHGPAVKSRGGYRICQSCYDGIISAEKPEAKHYAQQRTEVKADPPAECAAPRDIHHLTRNDIEDCFSSQEDCPLLHNHSWVGTHFTAEVKADPPSGGWRRIAGEWSSALTGLHLAVTGATPDEFSTPREIAEGLLEILRAALRPSPVTTSAQDEEEAFRAATKAFNEWSWEPGMFGPRYETPDAVGLLSGAMAAKYAFRAGAAWERSRADRPVKPSPDLREVARDFDVIASQIEAGRLLHRNGEHTEADDELRKALEELAKLTRHFGGENDGK